MSTTKPRSLLHIEYAEAAEAYLRSLPPEHFMESTAQSVQREITSESLALVRADRPEVQYFNELCVQYPFGQPSRIRQVVPDTMVVVHAEPIQAGTSYDMPFQPVKPTWMLEYVSKHSKRKDYDVSFRKYERELKIPWYLLFYPDSQELTLFHRRRSKYASVRPNAAGRLTIPALDLEMGLLDRWLRFWYKGQLLPLVAEREAQLREARAEALQAQAEVNHAQAEALQARAETEHAHVEAQRQRNRAEQLLAYMRSLNIEPPQ
jgi:Uma2 family endonuclease